jgi:predicted  nucleic acid-binding Zn-ribbon protein
MPPHPSLSALIRLQTLDQQLQTLRRERDALVPRREALAARRRELDGSLEALRKSLTEAQLKKKNLELDIEVKEQTARKHSSGLAGIKSNDAYRALLTEIEETKKAKSILEDQVLDVMEAVETLQRDIKAAEGRVREDGAALDRDTAELNERETSLRARWEEQKAARDQFFATIPAPDRERYEGVIRGRAGFSPLAPVHGMTCGGCRTSLPPSVVNEVMKGKELVSCEGCQRLLYLVPQPAPAPAT